MSDALPSFLVDPPWEREARAYREAAKAKKAQEPPLVPGLEPPDERRVVWAPGEREEWAQLCERLYVSHATRRLLDEGGWPAVVQDYRDGNFTYVPSQADMFARAPQDLVRPLLPDWHPRFHGQYPRDLQALAARFEVDAHHVVFANAKAEPYSFGPALAPFLDVEVARLMADWFVRLKSARDIASEWFARYGLDAVLYLVPDALGKRRVPREKAIAALSLIASEHGAPAVVETARRYGDDAAKTLELVLSAGPPDVVDKGPETKPAKPPKLPWLDRTRLPEVRLSDGQVLPPDARETLIGALALSQGGLATIYPGLDEVLEQCDRASLAALGRAIFEEWIATGTPSRSGWVLDQLCWLADDQAVRRLGTLLLNWPAAGTDKHAVQVLRVIGTDTALLQLHRLTQRVKAPGRRRTAEQCLAAAAQRRNLTTDELADRLVPDLGLDSAGTLVLDYGPRRFTVGFDEELKPFVTDEAGKHRKTLPKPAANDDPVLAPAAYERFGTFKKEVRGIASDQILRLEQAMLSGRRWSADDFQRFLVGHPLMWHIARRLVWTADDLPFRLAEDRTTADVHDNTVTLREPARIGIPHPLHLGDAVTSAWSEVFADYEILQPFRQLGRPVHTLTDEERRTGRLERFEGFVVPVGALLGLTRRGWERGPAEDGGMQKTMHRRCPDGPALVIDLAPGIAAGDAGLFPEQTLGWINYTDPPEDTLDPVFVSETLTDLASLVGDQVT